MKLKTLLTLAIASICSWQGAWADRVAPVFPSDQAKMLESGQSYLIYNPGSDRFVQRSSSSVIADPTSRAKVIVTNVEGDVYTLQFESSGFYIYSSSTNVSASSNPTASYRRFRIGFY